MLAVLAILDSCKKDIEIDYHQIEPLYVVEAFVTDGHMEARITQTNDMDNNQTTSGINQAIITVTGSDGSSAVLEYEGNGYYKNYKAKGTPGVEYTIDIQLKGQHFTSTSTMQKRPTINSFHFIWKKMLNEKYLMGKLLFQDIPNQDNWYFIHLYRNDVGYRWAVKRDDIDPNKELQQLFTFDKEGSTDDDMLREGDRIYIELRAIDQRAYDDLYSMEMMDNTGTNPIDNFTGGCLGYFSAYSQICYDCVFHEADVEEEN